MKAEGGTHAANGVSSTQSEIIFLVTENEADGGFTARALGHSIVTGADTWAELHASVRDAVRCHFDEGQAPAVIRRHSFLESGRDSAPLMGLSSLP